MFGMTKKSNDDELNLKIGHIGFWIKRNEIEWDDNKAIVLVNIIKSDGGLFILKDSDNKLKCFNVALGRGKTEIETDVSELDSEKEYFIMFTWDTISTKEISIWIDGECVEVQK